MLTRPVSTFGIRLDQAISISFFCLAASPFTYKKKISVIFSVPLPNLYGCKVYSELVSFQEYTLVSYTLISRKGPDTVRSLWAGRRAHLVTGKLSNSKY